MKNSLCGKIILLLLSVCPCAATAGAAPELSKILEETRAFNLAAAEESAGLSQRVSQLRAELLDAQKELDAAKAAALSTDAARAQAEHLRGLEREILEDLHSAENVVTGVGLRRHNIGGAQLLSLLQERMRALHGLALNPRVPQRISFERAADGRVKLRHEGDFFRVGPYGYFTDENSGDSFILTGFETKNISLMKETDSRPLKAFMLSGGELPLPCAHETGELSLSDMGFLEKFRAGGIWMWPIMLFGAVAFCLSIFKGAGIFSIRRAPQNAVQKISAALAQGRREEAVAMAEKIPQPYSKMLAELAKNSTLERGMLEEISYEYMLSAGEKLYYGLGLISITAAISPLFGLLGTVTGIIKTFGNLSAEGAHRAGELSQGIGEALITTEYGLIVAIPAFVVHALLSRRAKAVLSDMEKLASAFLSQAAADK